LIGSGGILVAQKIGWAFYILIV